MQVIVWTGVVLFSFVLAIAEFFLAKALERSVVLQREGDVSEVQGSPSGSKALKVLIALCFLLVIVVNLYLVKILFWGG